MQIDFRQISGPRGSKADNFALLCEQLVMAEWPNANPVEGRGGDEGIDCYIGQIDGEMNVFQFKYFLDGIGRSQKTQIMKSLETVLCLHQPQTWTLVIPVNMNIHQQRWFASLSKKYTNIRIDWWGETKLISLLSKHIGIAQSFFDPPDAPLLREMIRTQKIVFATMRNVEEKINLIGHVLQVKPKGINEEHQRALEFAYKDIIDRSRLSVLIWGPGKQGNEELYQKRLQIRNKLRELGHKAEFSEDILVPRALAAGGINLSVAELLQAQSYEYIICIMGSPGSI
jgi:hypothetical protein